MIERIVSNPFRWAEINGDGHEYLIGQGPFGDEFVQVDGEFVRRVCHKRAAEPFAGLPERLHPSTAT